MEYRFLVIRGAGRVKWTTWEKNFTEQRVEPINSIKLVVCVDRIEPIPHSLNSALALLSPSATRKHFRPKTWPSLLIISMLSAKQFP